MPESSKLVLTKNAMFRRSLLTFLTKGEINLLPEAIKELRTSDEILQAFPIMNQLRTHLDRDTYLDLVAEAQEMERYKLFALYDNGEIAAVVGFKPMVTLYYGRFVWVCDFVTDNQKRSKGNGKKLLTFVQEWATQNNYQSVSLSSGLHRAGAHRFYQEKMGYDKVSYVFKRNV
jgi:GNAT superfamily N-acetyltransferase